ncbi:hypothetical protein SLEP1_g13762 [Rubroshorea leprosula]|uniref:Uncharacterized protein n=1 Tax=Rubroshorea leprosula TaxID=152421 RepID=A0AAV5IQS9_9ROSI|nr:hypothetical protein SLEP1_g13762 [Rubroshorea leprosula]
MDGLRRVSPVGLRFQNLSARVSGSIVGLRSKVVRGILM